MNAWLSSALDASTPRLERSVFDLRALLDSAGVGATVSSHGPLDVIFSQGDPAREVMYIQRGMVKKSVTSGAGKEAVAAVLGPGEFFGEECLAGQRHRMASVSAMTASTVLTIDRQQMLGMLHRHAALADWFEEVLLGADESRERAAGPPIWLWPRDGAVFERPPQRKRGRSYMAKYGRKAQSKVARAMHERKRGTLRSGRSGKRVTSRGQAIAIGLSEARREGGKVPKPSGDRKRKRRLGTSS